MGSTNIGGGLFTPFVTPYTVGTFLSDSGSIVTGSPFSGKIESALSVTQGGGTSGAKHEQYLMTSAEKRQETASVSASAELEGWGVKASATSSFVQDSGTTGQSVSLILDSTTEMKTYVQKNFNQLRLTDEAAAYLKTLISKTTGPNRRNDIFSAFEKRYGAYVVDSIVYIASFTSGYQFDSESDTQSREIAASLSIFGRSGAYNGGVSGTASDGIKQAAERSNMRCTMVGKGLARTAGFPEFDAESIIDRWAKYHLSTSGTAAASNIGTPSKCTLMRLRDFACVRQVVDTEPDPTVGSASADNPQEAGLLSDDSRNSYMQRYNLVATILESLSVSSKVGCTARLLIAPYLSKWQGLTMQADYKLFEDEHKKLIKSLEELKLSVHPPEQSVPLVNGATYTFTCFDNQQQYKIMLQEVDTTKYKTTSLPTVGEARYFRLMRLRDGGADYLDGGLGGYWNNVSRFGDVVHNCWIMWQFIPMPQGTFLVRCLRNAMPNMIPQPGQPFLGHVMFSGEDANRPGGYTYTAKTVNLFRWRLTRIA